MNAQDRKTIPALDAYLQRAFEYSLDGVFIADKDGTSLYVNPAYEQISGLSKREIVGKNLKDLLEQKAFNESASLLVLERKKPVTLQHRYFSGKTALTTASPIFDDNGEIMGVICNTRDMKSLIDMQSELQKLAEIEHRHSLELDYLRKENYHADGMIHRSQKMERLLEQALNAAPYDSTILITGESGTGKELLAKFVFQNSLRNNGPFIRVNCAAIPKELFESELFGYMAGAFTGASTSGKAGMFELANQGTILLDEIGELSLPVQSKLLRVLQESEIFRVGGTTPIRLDVRVIASTNRNLLQEVKEENFREDLYYRLSVIPLHIAPLRERPEDVADLINYFLKELNRKYQKLVAISPKAIEALTLYSWPGNIRELENMMEYLFILNTEEEIRYEHLPSRILTEHMLSSSLEVAKPRHGLLQSLMEVQESRILESVLGRTKSMREAAEVLGVDASTICRKAKKYGLSGQP